MRLIIPQFSFQFRDQDMIRQILINIKQLQVKVIGDSKNTTPGNFLQRTTRNLVYDLGLVISYTSTAKSCSIAWFRKLGRT